VLEGSINAQSWSLSRAANLIAHAETTPLPLVINDLLELHDTTYEPRWLND
jgi:hypothetical protein